MNVCPTCHSRFVGGETFCPHDGSKLVDARELSPGELTGAKLDDVVRLDRLVHSDGLGERYAGRLLDNRRAVFVTVFDQAFVADDDARTRVETARSRVGSPLPVELNTVLQLHLDKNPPYLVESEPRGPSVAQLLEERRQLDWKEAVKLTAHLARIAQWLHEQGVPCHDIHPSSVYVTNLATGEVQLGDWAVDALIGSQSPESVLEENPDAFIGYADYLAPELSADSSASDLRSAVYAIGCLLYEMVLGKPPLPGRTPAETLKRHRHEKPVRLTIARGGGEFPPSLDDLVEMMLAKDPEKRFQSANAVVAALSNLVDLAPDELAPPLNRAQEAQEDDLYRTIDMDSVARDEILVPAAAAAEEPEASRAVSSGGTITGTSSTRDSGPKKTLLFEKVSDAVSSASAKAAAAAAAAGGDGAPPPRKTVVLGESRNTLVLGDDGSPESDGDERVATLVMGSATPARGATERGFGRDAASSAVLKQKKIGKVAPADLDERPPTNPDTVQAIKRSDISSELDVVDPPPVVEAIADDEAAKPPEEEVVDPREAPTRKLSPIDATTVKSPASTRSGKKKRKKGKRGRKSGVGDDSSATSDAAEDSVATEEAVSTEDAAAAPSAKAPAEKEPAAEEPVAGAAPPEEPADDEPAAEPAPVDAPLLARGRDHTRELDKSEWFSVPTEDAWDASLADEHKEQTERRFRFIIGGVLVALAITVLGLFVYFEYIYTPEDSTQAGQREETPAQSAKAEADAPTYDIAAGKSAFDRAAESGRLVEPLDNSAVTYLKELRRHAPESPEYTAARELFVAKAREKAVAADEAGNLNLARSLAGYASQFAPEDAELAAMTADLQARFTGQAPDTGAAENAQPQVEDVEVAAPAEPEPPRDAAQKTAKKSPSKRRAPKESAGDLLRDARVALGRGNTNEARLLYHQALELEPKNGEIHAGLGKVYFEQANYREAVKYQQKAIRYASGRLDYRIALGQSFYRLKKYEEAIDVWETVLKKDPDNRFARQYIELAKKKI